MCPLVHAILGWYMDTKLGRRQSRAKFARRLSVIQTSPCPISIVVKMPLLPYLDVPVGFLGEICRMKSALSGEDTVGECGKPLPSETDTLGINLTNTPEEHRTQSSDEEKAALLAAASGPCAPSESTFPTVPDMSCAVSHRCGRPEILTNSSESAGRSCGKDTLRAPPAQCDTFQPDVFSRVGLVSRAHPRRTREPNE